MKRKKPPGDLSVWAGIAQDAVVMNTDDVLCVGADVPMLLSSTIGRNKHLIPGEVIAAIINGTEDFLARMRDLGLEIYLTGGETADVGDLVRTVIVDSTVTCRMKRSDVIDNRNIAAGDVIVGFASYGQASYEDRYNGGMGSNGLTSARHDVLHHAIAAQYPESYDSAIPENLVYSGRYALTDPTEIPGVDMGRLILSPTRTYAPIIRTMLKEYRQQIHGMVHCSGGAQTKVLHFLFQVGADKALLAVHIKLLVRDCGTGSLDVFKIADFCTPFTSGTVFLLDLPEPLDGVVNNVLDVVAHLVNVHLNVLKLTLRLLYVELGNLSHRFLGQFKNILTCDLAPEQAPVRVERTLNVGNLRFERSLILLQLLIYSLLKEDFLQRNPMPFLGQFTKEDFQFASENVHSPVGGMAEDALHISELDFTVNHHTGDGIDCHLTLCEGVQSVNCLVGRGVGRQLQDYFRLFRGFVQNLGYFKPALLHGLGNVLNQGLCGGGVWYLRYYQVLLVLLQDFGTDEHFCLVSDTVVIFAHIDETAGREIRINLEIASLQIIYGGVNQFVEIVRKNQ